jgi:hypothetical protein
VLFNFFDAHWLKGSESNVERDLCRFDAAFMEAGKNFRCEMKAGGRSSDRSALAGVYSLVAVSVGSGVVSCDVWRQRNVANPFLACEKIVDGSEADVAFSKFSSGDDLCPEFVSVTKKKMLADHDLTAGADQAFPVVRFALELTREENFHAPVKEISRSWIVRTDGLGLKTCTASIEAGRKNARIVKDDQIVGTQQLGKITKSTVGN